MAKETKEFRNQASDVAVVRDVGFRRLKSETLELPRAEALKFAETHLALPKSPTERDLVQQHLQELVARFRAGCLVSCCWAVAQFKGVKYRMNGQHSSKAIIAAAEFLPEIVAIHLDHYEATTAHGMGILFRQFDARFSSRTKSEVAGAYKGVCPSLDDVDRNKAKLGMEGIVFYERQIEKVPVPSGDNIFELFLLEKYHPFVIWIENILSSKTPELKRAGVVAAMYATHLQSQPGATDFWYHVARQDLGDDSDPRMVLSLELQKIHDDRRKQRLRAIEFYAKCVKAWNAYRVGDKIKSLTVNTSKVIPDVAA